MYHQNKTLKELENISYNANYQADIEDIGELQKNRAISLDNKTQKIFFLIAIASLAGKAPIFISKYFCYSIISNIFNTSDSNDFKKHHIKYNHAISSYELVNNLKQISLIQTIANNPFSFELFPKLLKETPITEEQNYIYRENYKILEELQNSSIQLTLYIVYSFVLKFDNHDRENQNIYNLQRVTKTSTK